MAAYVQRERVSAIVDATHPYAAVISRNAMLTSEMTGVSLLALRRPPWTRETGDLWDEVGNAEAAAALLGAEPRRVFLALGRQEVRTFEAAPQHHYLIRSVDPISPPLRVPRAEYVLGRGPFDGPKGRAMLVEHAIEAIVTKNTGGSVTYGKIAAARELGLKVLVLRRPVLPTVPEVRLPEDVLIWLDHVLALRGV